MATCPTCSGSGMAGSAPCPNCKGTGSTSGGGGYGSADGGDFPTVNQTGNVEKGSKDDF